jgi:hypothetical protein
MSQTTELTTMYSKIVPDQIYATDLEDNQRSKGQKIAYPRYQSSDAPLFLQCEWFELNSYGIPGRNEFFTDDSQRLFIKVPLDQSNPKVKEFSEWLKLLDAHIGSDSFKEKLFGTKKDKYQYQSCFRLPQDDEDDKKKNPNKKDYGPKLPYMKLKVDTSFPDNKIKSPVFKSVMENGTRVRSKIDNINTIDDLSSHISFLSKFRPIIRPVKFWAQAPNKKDPMYGLTFKMIKAEVEPRAKNNANIQQYMDSDVFLNSDEDEHVVMPPRPPPNVAVSKKIVQVDSDEESDDESDDEVVTKVASKVVVDDSESDDESVKVQSKKVANVVDSDSDEDVKPKKQLGKKPVKTKKANA